MLLLIWIIVFKFRMDIFSLKYIRSINLVPFKNNGYVNGIRETFINIVLFVPLGMYLKYFFRNSKFLNLEIIILTSFCFEVFQYILRIGVSDITDIIYSTSYAYYFIFDVVNIFLKLPCFDKFLLFNKLLFF